MAIIFDPGKDAANIAKHGVSLARAADLIVIKRVTDDRYAEPRLRAYGTIDGLTYCLAYVIRDGEVRDQPVTQSCERDEAPCPVSFLNRSSTRRTRSGRKKTSPAP